MTTSTQNFPFDGLARKPQVLAFLNISNTKLYAAIKSGEIPAPIKLGKVSAWKATDIRRIAGYNVEA